MYTLRWARDAAAFYDGLGADQQERIDDALLELATDPVIAPGVKRLKGEMQGLSSRRVGSWRVIITFDHSTMLLDILVLADRKESYR